MGRAELQKGLALRPHAALENPEGYLTYKGKLLGARGLNPPPAPQPRETEPGRETHPTSSCENQQGFYPLGREGIVPETQVSS